MWRLLPISCLLACAGPPDAKGLEPLTTASGTITWRARFDDTARAAGLADCDYTRTYDAVEDRSTPWLCPDCDVVLAADVRMGAPDLACYRSFSGADPSPREHLGWTGDHALRGGAEFAPLSEIGTFTEGPGGDTLRFGGTTNAVRLSAGTVTFEIDGHLAVGERLGDPMQGHDPPDTYACGWPRPDPADYDGRWRVRAGKQLPDGWFGDACDESVRLWDFVGRYLVVDVSAMDCGPCQAMAAEEAAFVEDLRRRGVQVQVVTLLAPSLSAVLDPAPASDLAEWTGAFGLDTVVLGDRGWGWSMAATVWPDGMSYPSWFLASPSLEVIDSGQGYPGWGPIRDRILTDLETR